MYFVCIYMFVYVMKHFHGKKKVLSIIRYCYVDQVPRNGTKAKFTLPIWISIMATITTTTTINTIVQPPWKRIPQYNPSIRKPTTSIRLHGNESTRQHDHRLRDLLRNRLQLIWTGLNKLLCSLPQLDDRDLHHLFQHRTILGADLSPSSWSAIDRT